MPGSRIGRATPGSTVSSRRSRWSAPPRRARQRACASLRIARADRLRRPDRGWSVVSATGDRQRRGRSSRTTTSPGSVLSSCVRLKNSLAVPATVTASPTATAGAVDVKTKSAFRRRGIRRQRRRPASAGRTRLSSAPVTMPVVVTSWPSERRREAAALDVVNRGRREVAAPGRRRALRGVGAPIEKVDVVVVRNRSSRRACAARPSCCSAAGVGAAPFEAVRARRSRPGRRCPASRTCAGSAVVVRTQRHLAGRRGHRDRCRSRPAPAAASVPPRPAAC